MANKIANYIFNSKKNNIDLVVKKANHSIDLNGFVVLENIIPKNKINIIKKEIILAHKKIRENTSKVIKLTKNNLNEEQLLSNKNIKLRKTGMINRPSKLPNDIIWMPKYAKYLSNNIIIKIAKSILDDHIRVAQLHPKFIKSTKNKETKFRSGKDIFGLPRLYEGDKSSREWHTDWPHDLSAYGGDNPYENIGNIRDPFPDITMCLVMIWYFTDVDENSGGTFVVPGSHKDKRTPRSKESKIDVSSPLKDELQIKAKAGSVLIKDSRIWHSAPSHNQNTQDRIAVVNRWAPWWLSVNEFAQKSRLNGVCRPINKKEYNKLPKKLRPYFRHLCFEVNDHIQSENLKKAKIAADVTNNYFKKSFKRKINNNKNIRVYIKNYKSKFK